MKGEAAWHPANGWSGMRVCLLALLAWLNPAVFPLPHLCCREGEEGHFEKAVLYAINSGGNNMARAALTGALFWGTVHVLGREDGRGWSDRLAAARSGCAVAWQRLCKVALLPTPCFLHGCFLFLAL